MNGFGLVTTENWLEEEGKVGEVAYPVRACKRLARADAARLAGFVMGGGPD